MLNIYFQDCQRAESDVEHSPREDVSILQLDSTERAVSILVSENIRVSSSLIFILKKPFLSSVPSQ